MERACTRSSPRSSRTSRSSADTGRRRRGKLALSNLQDLSIYLVYVYVNIRVEGTRKYVIDAWYNPDRCLMSLRPLFVLAGTSRSGCWVPTGSPCADTSTSSHHTQPHFHPLVLPSTRVYLRPSICSCHLDRPSFTCTTFTSTHLSAHTICIGLPSHTLMCCTCNVPGVLPRSSFTHAHVVPRVQAWRGPFGHGGGHPERAEQRGGGATAKAQPQRLLRRRRT
jgi:hypothetical protein